MILVNSRNNDVLTYIGVVCEGTNEELREFEIKGDLGPFTIQITGTGTPFDENWFWMGETESSLTQTTTLNTVSNTFVIKVKPTSTTEYPRKFDATLNITGSSSTLTINFDIAQNQTGLPLMDIVNREVFGDG